MLFVQSDNMYSRKTSKKQDLGLNHMAGIKQQRRIKYLQQLSYFQRRSIVSLGMKRGQHPHALYPKIKKNQPIYSRLYSGESHLYILALKI